MIIHKLVPKAGIVHLTPENAEDIWLLRRIVSPNDLVSGETSRAVKNVGDYVRPDKGDRIKISVTLKVERILLDSVLGRLRIIGDLVSSSSQLVSKGSSHSLVVTAAKRIGLRKEHMSNLEIRLLKKSTKEDAGFLLIAIDRREAGLGLVKGVHLQVFPTIQSGFSGKFYREAHKSFEPFFKKIEEALNNVFMQGMITYVSGPGPTKNELINFLSDSGSTIATSARLIEGVDSAGEDGIHLALHSPNLKKDIASSRLGKAAALLEEAVRRIAIDDNRLTLGFSETQQAAQAGAVESLLVSDKIFELAVEEDDVVQLLNKVESLGGKTFLIDSSTDLGIQVSKLGGVIGLLRYAVYV